MYRLRFDEMDQERVKLINRCDRIMADYILEITSEEAQFKLAHGSYTVWCTTQPFASNTERTDRYVLEQWLIFRKRQDLMACWSLVCRLNYTAVLPDRTMETISDYLLAKGKPVCV